MRSTRALGVVAFAGGAFGGVLGGACSSRTPAPAPSKPPPEAPREVFFAYHVDNLRIEGAPPIDPAIATAFDARPVVETARLIGQEGPFIRVTTPTDCQTIQIRSGSATPVRAWCSPTTTWSTFAGGGIEVVDHDDERSTLRVGGRALVLPDGRISDPILDPTRTSMYFALGSTEAPTLWTLDVVASPTAPRLVAADGPWAPLDTSPAGRRVLARRELSSRDAALYSIDTRDGGSVALTEPGTVTTRARFLDGDLIAATDVDSDRRRLVRYTGRGRYPIASFPGEVVDFAFAGDRIVVETTDHGLSSLWTLDGTTALPVASARDDGVITDLHADRKTSWIGFAYSSSTIPRRVEVHDLDPSGGYAPITVIPRAQPSVSVPVAMHEINASDGVEIQLLVYTPPKVVRPPVVIELHGGPEDRWLPKYDPFAQFLVSQGFAVIRPNVRGSAGQGRVFLALDDGPLREDALRDVAATLDWIATQPGLDRSRVAIAGTSYGGYLALAALRAFPDRLRGGVTLSPITDFVGFLEGTAGYRRDHRRAEYGDERDPKTREFLTRISPIAHVQELTRPLLVAYGLRDPRVPPATTERFIREARGAGARVWSIAASDEGHWFERENNRRGFEILTVQFLRSL